MVAVSLVFYRVNACGTAVAILSVRLFVCPSDRLSDACVVTKLNDALRIF